MEHTVQESKGNQELDQFVVPKKPKTFYFSFVIL